MRAVVCFLFLCACAGFSAAIEPPENQPAQPATQPSDELPVASRAQRDELIAAARRRAGEDRQKYSAEQLKDAEDLYQIANKDWRSDGAKAALRAMIEKYPDINRTGCAVLYMGQMSRNTDEAERYFRQAINDYSDCCFLNGAQVGALARLYLAGRCMRDGRGDDAKKLLDEIDQQFPSAIDHRGRLLAGHIRLMRQQLDAKSG